MGAEPGSSELAFGYLGIFKSCMMFDLMLISRCLALAGSLSWLECHPIHQNVAGSISGQGTYLGCEYMRQPIDISFSY